MQVATMSHTVRSSDGTTLRTVSKQVSLEEVRDVWEVWQDHPNNDLAHFELVCRLRPEVVEPIVTVVEKAGRPRAILASRLERISFAPRIGYLTPLKIPATVLTVIYRGALGDVDHEAAVLFVDHVKALLASGKADVAEIHHIPDSSALLSTLNGHADRWWCQVAPVPNVHWQMRVVSEAEFFDKKLRSKHRSWMRRKQRELLNAFPERICWRWVSEFDDIPGLCQLLEGVAKRTYQRELGGGFIDDEEHRQRFELFAKRGQLRVQLLEIDGVVRAFWLGTIYKGVFHSAETAYDPELRPFEVGTQVFIRMVTELAREGVETLDFGLGDAFYKQRFGDQRWSEVTARLFAATGKGVALYSTAKLFGLADQAGRALVRGLGVLDRVKTGWRRRLVQSKSSAEQE